VLVVRAAPDDDGAAIECLVDTRRCAGVDFASRAGSYAITLRRDDDASFLSVLLEAGADGAPVPDAAVKRWRHLRDAYASFSSSN